MFELSGVNYEEVLEQGDSILVRVIASSSYRGFELSGLNCIPRILNSIFTALICIVFSRILAFSLIYFIVKNSVEM